MPAPQLTDQARQILRAPAPAVIATLRRDGTPVTVATWFLLEDDDRILVNMDHSRVRLKHLRRDPRVSITVLAEGDWYTHVSLVGRVDELRNDDGLVDADRLSQHYRERPYPDRVSPRVSALVVLDRCHTWGPRFGRP